MQSSVLFLSDSFTLISQLCAYFDELICTWSLDTVTEVVSKVVDDVQQEGEVSHIVHVNTIRITGNGPQLILISILHT